MYWSGRTTTTAPRRWSIPRRWKMSRPVLGRLQRLSRSLASRNDTVEVFRIPLRLHHALASALRAPEPVRFLPGRFIKSLGYGFPGDSRDCLCPVIEINDFFRAADRESLLVAHVAVVRRQRREPFGQTVHHRGVPDGAGISTAADCQEAPVLCRNGGHPEFGLDIGVHRRGGGQLHATERLRDRSPTAGIFGQLRRCLGHTLGRVAGSRMSQRTALC